MRKEIVCDLKSLDDSLLDLLNILKRENNSSTKYAEKTILVMRKNIDAALRENDESEEIFLFLRSEYKSMFPAKSGLSEFYIWDDNFSVRKKLNLDFESIKQSIEKILLKYSSFVGS